MEIWNGCHQIEQNVELINMSYLYYTTHEIVGVFFGFMI